MKYLLIKHQNNLCNEIVPLLENVKLYNLLNDEEKKILINNCEIVEYKNNDTIYHKDDEGDLFFIILKGKCYMSDINISGGEGIIKQYEFFGYRALFLNKLRQCNVICDTNVSLLVINKDIFLKLYSNKIDELEKEIVLRTIKCLPQLRKCLYTEKQLLIKSAIKRNYEINEIICSRGIEADSFYIIKHGKVKCVYSSNFPIDAYPERILETGDYFNENVFVASERKYLYYIILV